jgi:glutathione S-transferase
MSGAEYEIIYWPVIPGRAEYIRLLFEEAGVPYKEQSSDPGEAAAAVQALTSETAKPDTFGANPPPRAVPALRHGDLLLSQTTTILQYLAPRLGLVPSKASEADSLHLNSIALTLLDGFCIELHDTHHPIAISQYYEDQKPEAKKRAKQFVDERLPNYVGWVQRLLEANTSGDGPWLYGDSLTYVDLVLFQVSCGGRFA